MAIILNKLPGCMHAVATSLEGGSWLRQLDNNAIADLLKQTERIAYVCCIAGH